MRRTSAGGPFPRPFANDDDEVTIVGTSTPEERDAEKRKHAFDVELFEPKRSKTPPVELETSVAKLRSVLTRERGP